VAGEPTNPYAPPTAEDWEDTDDRPDVLVPFPRPLFSPGQALVATIFGSVFAGVFMLQMNYRAMRRSGAANKALVLGLLCGIGVMALGFVMPKEIPTLPVTIAVAVAFYQVFKSLQGELFIINRSAGGDRRSNWLVLGIIVATLVALLLVVFAVVFGFGLMEGDFL
jgi:hypothetical protein